MLKMPRAALVLVGLAAGLCVSVIAATTGGFPSNPLLSTVRAIGNPALNYSFIAGAPDTAIARFETTEAITAHAHYGFLDDSSIALPAGITGHASFNSNPALSGANNFDHHHDYQATPSIAITGTATELSSFYSLPTMSSGSITQLNGIFVNDATKTGGTITTDIGVHVGAIGGGSTNYAIKTDGTAQVNFGGSIVANGFDMTPTSGTFTATYTGMTAATTCTATYYKVGFLVSLVLCAATGTSNAPTFTMSGLPALIQPATLSQDFYCAGLEDNTALLINGTSAPTGRITAVSGTVTFLKAGSTWTASGTKGIANPCPVTYLVN